jgi:hypothetical protein
MSGILSSAGFRYSVFGTVSRPNLGPTQPPIQWPPAVLSSMIERRELEADLSPPSGVEVKNACK